MHGVSDILAQPKSSARRKNSRDRILNVATKHFAKNGYLGTSLEQVVKDAGLTRGALYYHFTDKHDLFRQVCHNLQSNNAKKINRAINRASDPWDAFVSAVHATLDSATSSVVRRILFVERVSVLSWEEWHAIDTDTIAGSLRPAMERAMDEGYMERRPVPAFFFLITASISRITTIAADSDEIDLNDIHAEFDELLAKYRIKAD